MAWLHIMQFLAGGRTFMYTEFTTEGRFFPHVIVTGCEWLQAHSISLV